MPLLLLVVITLLVRVIGVDTRELALVSTKQGTGARAHGRTGARAHGGHRLNIDVLEEAIRYGINSLKEKR